MSGHAPAAGRHQAAPWRVVAAHALLFAVSRDPLDLKIRREIFEHVGRFPGLHLREIARALEIHPNHAKYHLQRLEKHGLVSSRKERGYWRFWPREEGSIGMRDKLSRDDKTLLAVLRRPIPLHVCLLLLDRGEATHGELLQEVDVAHSTLHYHLSKMESSGMVESRKPSRERFFQLRQPDRVAALLLEYRPPRALVRRFLDAWEQLEADPATLGPAARATKQVVGSKGRIKLGIRKAPGGAAPEPGTADDPTDPPGDAGGDPGGKPAAPPRPADSGRGGTEDAQEQRRQGPEGEDDGAPSRRDRGQARADASNNVKEAR